MNINILRRATDSGYLNPIHRGYINEGTVTQQNEYEEIDHITNNPTYVNTDVDTTGRGVDAIIPVPSVPTAEQQDAEYERLRRANGAHNLSGWFKQHKILVGIVLTVLVTMVITAGFIVGVMMAVTKENTGVVKDTDKSETSPVTTLLVTKENMDNDMNTQTTVTTKENIMIATGCSDPGNVLFSNRSPDYRNIFNEGEIVTYTCQRCYLGSKTVTCISGVWVGLPVTCSRIVCNFIPPRPNIQYNSSGNSCGTVIMFSCNQGFQLIGPEKTECNQVNEQTAQWTNQLPTCKPIVTTPSFSSGNIASLVVIGGWKRDNGRWEILNTVDIYRLNSGRIEWSHQGAPSPFSGAYLGRAVDNGDVYVLGGETYRDGVGIPQYRGARYSVADNTWQQLPDITWDTHYGPAVFIHQNTLYSAYTRDIWALELTQTSSGMWTEENIKLPLNVRGPDAVVSVGDTVFIIGENGVYSKSVISWLLKICDILAT